MWPYFLLLFIIVIIQFKLVKNSQPKLRFYIGITVLFLFAGLRGMSNGDYTAYLERGKHIDTLCEVFHNNTNMEMGYSFIYYLVNLLRLPGQCVIAGMNLISIGCLAKLIKRYSPNWCLSLLLFLPLYFQFDMHAARTAAAISISALSITYAYKRQPVRFLLVIFAASLFHKTAFIVLPLYFIVKIKVNLYMGMMTILAEMCLVYFIGIDRVVLLILDKLPMKLFYLKYLGYAKSQVYGYRFSLLDPRLWLFILIFILAKLICKNAEKLEELFIKCCFLNVSLLILFSEHTFIAYRLSAFFNIYSIILIPMLLRRVCDKSYYRNQYLLKKNALIATSFVLALFTAYAMAYVYTGYIAKGLEYQLFAF